MEKTYEERLRSGAAIVATRHIAGDYGGATVWCVVLADGFIVELGCQSISEARAHTLARIINQGHEAAFTEDALLKWKK